MPAPKTLSVTTPNENLVFELAFAIDDPCGADAIELAKALIEYGKSIPAHKRLLEARIFLDMARGNRVVGRHHG